ATPFWESSPRKSRNWRLLPAFAPNGENIRRNPVTRDRAPLHLERSVIPEQRTPGPIVYVDFDVETLIGIVVPLAHLSYPGKNHGKAESEHAFIKTLFAGAQPQSPTLVHGQVNIDSEMLVGAQVVDDLLARAAVDHVGIEAAGILGAEAANPGDGLAAVLVHGGVGADRERHIAAAFGKHDPPPGPDVQKGQRVEGAVPDFIHHAGADRSHPVSAAESKPFLDPRMQTRELLPERHAIDRIHEASWGGRRKHALAVGIFLRASHASAASAAPDKFNGTGLTAPVRYSGELAATPMSASIMSRIVSHKGQRDFQHTRTRSPTQTSSPPAIAMADFVGTPGTATREIIRNSSAL